MSNCIIAGNPAPQQMPTRMTARRIGGRDYEQRWHGEAEAVRTYYEVLVASGADEVTYDQAPGSAVAMVSARYSGTYGEPNEQAVETMEIDFADVTFPIHQNPSFVGLSTQSIRLLEDAIKNETGRDEVLASMIDLIGEAATDNGTGSHGDYWDTRARGIESYRVFVPVVVWTRTVSAQYPAGLELDNVGSIFSTAALSSAMGTPILFSIPTGNVGIAAGGSAPQFYAGWLKTGRVSLQSDGKIQLVLKGEYGLWAGNLYTIVSSD
jgi:hypothetical protein